MQLSVVVPTLNGREELSRCLDTLAAYVPDAETIAEQYEGYGPHSARDVHHGYLTGDGPEDLERTPDEIADRDDYERWVDGYDVGVRYMDDYIGRILDALEEAGVLDETLIVFSADHGENLGELNVYGDHQTADDKTCRVPLIVRGPGVEPAAVRFPWRWCVPAVARSR